MTSLCFYNPEYVLLTTSNGWYRQIWYSQYAGHVLCWSLVCLCGWFTECAPQGIVLSWVILVPLFLMRQRAWQTPLLCIFYKSFKCFHDLIYEAATCQAKPQVHFKTLVNVVPANSSSGYLEEAPPSSTHWDSSGRRHQGLKLGPVRKTDVRPLLSLLSFKYLLQFNLCFLLSFQYNLNHQSSYRLKAFPPEKLKYI